MESLDKENKRRNRERYKMEKKEAKIAMMAAKMTAFEHLYEELECKSSRVQKRG